MIYKMDLQSVVSKNIDEYLKPKYPLYRVKYFKAVRQYVENGRYPFKVSER